MKTVTKMFAVAIALISTFAILESCQKQENEAASPTPASESFFKKPSEITNNAYLGGMRLPDNSKVTSTDKSQLQVEFPEGIVFISNDDKGNIAQTSMMGYSCTCSGRGGCDVYEVKVDGKLTYGCAEGSCSATCSGTKTKEARYSNVGSIFTDDMFLKGGFVNLKSRFRVLSNSESLSDDLKTPNFQTLMSLDAFRNGFDDFVLKAYGVSSFSEINPDKITTLKVGVEIFGVKMIMQLPKDYVDNYTKNARTSGTLKIANAEPTCNCNSGTSGCIKEEITRLGGTVHVAWKCTGGSCTSCEMKTNHQQ